jgi:hypothetical protein
MYNYAPGDYYTYNFTGTSCCPAANVDLFIGAAQGFFVTMKDGAAGSDTVTFNNTLRSDTYTNSVFYKGSNPNVLNVNNLERNRIWLDIVNSAGQTDRTLVGYVEGATMNRDSFFDAATVTTGVMTIYSLINTDKFTIQGRPVPFNSNDIVPIGVSVPVTGSYSIAIGGVDGLFVNPNKNIYLEDTQLGIVHNLRVSPYVVTLNSGTFNERFKLRYKYSRRNQHNDKVDLESINERIDVSSFEGKINIKSSYQAIDEVTVFDVLGRQLFEAKNIGSNEFTASEVTLSQQTLVVKIKLEDGTVVTKKIVL